MYKKYFRTPVMSLKNQSQMFRYNNLVWKVFGIWAPESIPMALYKLFSLPYLATTLVLYNLLLIINLLYTPTKVDLMAREVIFIFTEMAVTAKVLMVLCMRKKIQEAFTRLDSDILKRDDDTSKRIVDDGYKAYVTFYVFFTCSSHFALVALILQGVSENELPICQYYFLPDDIKDKYYILLYSYQVVGIYGHMMYNINMDTFMSGLIWMAVLQIKVLKHKLANLRLSESELMLTKDEQEKAVLAKMNTYLRRYDYILSYVTLVQKIINMTMFVQFGIAAAIICVVLYGLALSDTAAMRMFMISYLVVMSIEIIVPGWIGTELTYEGKNLATAAFESDWIPRTEKFKRNLKLFVERTNKPIQLFGLKMFPLALGSVTSILKTAYSFFALLRSIQE